MVRFLIIFSFWQKSISQVWWSQLICHIDIVNCKTPFSLFLCGFLLTWIMQTKYAEEAVSFTGNHLFPKILDLCAKFLTHKHIWSSYMNSLQEWNKREAKVNFISWMGNHSSAERKKTTGNKKWTTFSKWNLETKKWCQWTLIFSYFSEMALKLFASEKKHILK